MAQRRYQEKLVRELAEEYDLNISTVEKIVRSQFLHVKKTMAAGNFKGIRLAKIGRWFVSDRKKKAVLRRRERIKKEQDALLSKSE